MDKIITPLLHIYTCTNYKISSSATLLSLSRFSLSLRSGSLSRFALPLQKIASAFRYSLFKIGGGTTNVRSKPNTYRSSSSPPRFIRPSQLLYNSSLTTSSRPLSNRQASPFKPIWVHLLKKSATKSPTLVQCGISSNDLSASDGRSFRGWVEVVSEAISTLFPIWVSLGCVLGLLKPSTFSWVTPELTIPLLSITMLGMGMTLTLDDLRNAFAMPKELISGFVLQYSVMPLSGFLVSKLLNLPSYYAAGLILVGCCPGGTASNIVTYMARGNVALSVLMTATSTVTAVVMTPFLTAKLAGQYVAVDAAGLLLSTLQVVLLPVLAGAFLNQYFQSLVKFVSPLMAPIVVGTVAILCGTAIAQSSSAILTSGGQVVLAAALLHASGFFFGYLLSRLLGVDVASSRTISIEVGMQVNIR